MINIKNLVNNYINEGYEEIYANAKVAQDIILTYLFRSKYKNNITIKGGVVMYNLSNNARRATIDIDLDLIKIYLADDNLYNIFNTHKLEGISIYVDKNRITDLKHQDYKGKRIPITISDNYGNELNTKVDVGVHTEFDIAQDEIYFDSCLEDKKIKLLVNSKEQIFVEKIIPIIKFGVLSTRYKDYYDLYWLIKNGNMNKNQVIKIMNNKIFEFGINGIDSLEKLIDHIDSVLSDNTYLSMVNSRKNNWLDISLEELRNTIVNYLSTIITINV